MSVTGGFAMMAVHFLLTIITVAILYANGEGAARGILMFAWRIGRERAENSVRLAGQAVQGVALGVVLTALIQSAIAGIGLLLAGVPRAGLLIAMRVRSGRRTARPIAGAACRAHVALRFRPSDDGHRDAGVHTDRGDQRQLSEADTHSTRRRAAVAAHHSWRHRRDARFRCRQDYS